MLFHRNERKNGLAGLYLAVGTLALIGALGITAKGKRCINTMGKRIKGMMCRMSGGTADSCGSEG